MRATSGILFSQIEIYRAFPRVFALSKQNLDKLQESQGVPAQNVQSENSVYSDSAISLATTVVLEPELEFQAPVVLEQNDKIQTLLQLSRQHSTHFYQVKVLCVFC
jgi:hypothetical protein